MTARRKGWIILALGALAAAVALAWVSVEALSLEREGARAKAEASFEERVRLALWRMDSYLAPIVAAEAVRPHFHYAPFYAEEDAFTRAWNDIPAGEVLVASPLLNSANPNGYIHFEIPPEGGVRSPQAPEGAMEDNAVPTYMTNDALKAANGKLDELREMLSPEAISSIRARAGEERMTELVSSAGSISLATNKAPQPTIPKIAKPGGSSSRGEVAATVEDSQPKVAQQTPSPLQEEQQKQEVISGQELSSRNKANRNAAGQGLLNQFQVRRNVSPGRQGPSSSRSRQGKVARAEDAATSAEEVARQRPPLEKTAPAPSLAAPAAPQEPVEVARAQPAALPGHVTASGSSERLKLGSLVPTWVGSERNELVLVRMVERGTSGGEGEGGGRRYVQGIWLKWPEIRRQLLKQVRDLLPEARLSPAPGGTSDPARALASIPAALDPGEAAVAAESGTFTPTRVALLAAWGALAAAIAASALSLRAANDLSDRRARFVSTVTHELRTPLTTFQLYTDMLASGMAPAESRDEYLATLKGESERLSLLMENVLAYARLEDGRVARAPVPVNSGELLEGALARSRERAEACGMALAVEVTPEAARATALADAAAVEQVLFNLVDNACKHGGGGEDDVESGDAERRTVSVRASLEGRFVTIRVADRGPGVPVADRKRIFEPFHRAEGATAAGVGLGLALSRNLARAGGGDLTCEPPSAEGGAVFALRMPVCVRATARTGRPLA